MSVENTIKPGRNEDKQSVFSIEIPKAEMEAVNSIRDFVEQLSQKELGDFNGPIGYKSGTSAKIESILQEKLQEIESRSYLSDDEKNSLGITARHEAQYEACKDVIEYQKQQLGQLLSFIENQKIWKHKFTTAANVNFYSWRDNPVEDFKKLLEQSEELHKDTSFAGQNMNSIYFVSKSGLPLRVKPANLFNDGNIKESLQYSNEVIIFVDDISDEDYKQKSSGNIAEFPAKYVSFDPKNAYRVEEFITKEFKDHQTGDYKSKIDIFKQGDKLIVKGYDGFHGGHYVNRVYF